MASSKKLREALDSGDVAGALAELKTAKQSTYEKNLEGTLARIKTQTRASQNIGMPPTDRIDYARRDAANASLRVFLETYFPAIFHMKWSDDHLRLLKKLERAIRQGELSAVAMPRGMGKALALDTPIPTPSGWSTMGDLKVGNTVFDEKGQQCRVTFATEVQLGRECFEVSFSDGEKIIADADHLWTVKQKHINMNDGYITLTTRQILDAEIQFQVPIAGPHAYTNRSNLKDIVSIEKTPSVPVRCIQVDSSSHLFLAGRHLTPTHNTSMLIRTGQWAILTGLRNYVAIIAATETKAQSLLKSLKTEILHNQLLRQDYGPQLHCLTSLGNRASLASGQHVDGDLTGVEWNISRLNTGFIKHPECLASNNASIVTMGITGDIRGEQVTSVDGRILRPDLVLIDDPQTKGSASSVTQVQMRHETLVGDVLGMAGPGKSIAGLAAITVICKNDLSDRLLDKEESPEWQGERCKMVYRWPDNENLWDEYRSIYEEELRGERGHQESLRFVGEHYEAMHEGSKVGWEARYDPDKELSALHNAYNLRIRDEGAFHAEYQNEPLTGREQLAFDIDPRDVARRTTPNLFRGEAPSDCQYITAAIDIQAEALFFMVCGWTTAGRCHIMDYGSYPDQGRMYYSKSELSKTLSSVLGVDEEAARVIGGLDACTRALMEHEYEVGDGSVRLVDKCIIDSGWNTELVRRFCRESFHKSRLHPAKGQYIGANSKKWQKLKLERREQKGMHCKLQPPSNKERGRPELLIDTNFWKTWAADRLTCNQFGNRAIVLFDASPAEHRMVSEHMASENPKRCEGKNGDVVIEWDQPAGVDNEFWDVLVYNGAAASVLGVQTHDLGAEKKKPSNSAAKKPKLAPRDSSATLPAADLSIDGPSAKADFSNMTARERLEARRKKR